MTKKDSTHNINIIALHETPENKFFDFIPKSFDDYIGQKKLKEKLNIYTKAAKMRNEPLDHLLFFGPPGLGKTTLCRIMAEIMEVSIKICSGPMMEKTGDVVAILSSLSSRDILFIDEIHRMPSNVEEVLYSAMEYFRVDLIIGKGTGAKTVNLPINPFTLVGATTKIGMISAPLRSRFGITERLDFYPDDELCSIVLHNAVFLNFAIEQDAALLIGKASRGTPRIAKKLLRRIRDVAQVNQTHADKSFVQKTLSLLGIHEDGLTSLDVLLLRKIITLFNGGPVGIETLASLVDEDTNTIETVYEPFLLRKGYLEKTARGRQISPARLPILMQKYLGQKRVLDDDSSS